VWTLLAPTRRRPADMLRLRAAPHDLITMRTAASARRTKHCHILFPRCKLATSPPTISTYVPTRVPPPAARCCRCATAPPAFIPPPPTAAGGGNSLAPGYNGDSLRTLPLLPLFGLGGQVHPRRVPPGRPFANFLHGFYALSCAFMVWTNSISNIALAGCGTNTAAHCTGMSRADADGLVPPQFCEPITTAFLLRRAAWFKPLLDTPGDQAQC